MAEKLRLMGRVNDILSRLFNSVASGKFEKTLGFQSMLISIKIIHQVREHYFPDTCENVTIINLYICKILTFVCRYVIATQKKITT